MLLRTTNYLTNETIDGIAGASITLAKTLNDRAEIDMRDVRAFLGNVLDVWPESVRRDVDADNWNDRVAGRLVLPDALRPYVVRDALAPVPADVLDGLAKLAGAA